MGKINCHPCKLTICLFVVLDFFQWHAGPVSCKKICGLDLFMKKWNQWKYWQSIFGLDLFMKILTVPLVCHEKMGVPQVLDQTSLQSPGAPPWMASELRWPIMHRPLLGIRPEVEWKTCDPYCWLVVYPPSWKIWVRQLEWWSPIYGKIENVPNHQPDWFGSWWVNQGLILTACNLAVCTTYIRYILTLSPSPKAKPQFQWCWKQFCNDVTLW